LQLEEPTSDPTPAQSAHDEALASARSKCPQNPAWKYEPFLLVKHKQFCSKCVNKTEGPTKGRFGTHNKNWKTGALEPYLLKKLEHNND